MPTERYIEVRDNSAEMVETSATAKQTPYYLSVSGTSSLHFAFVPYRNQSNVSVGTGVYDCYLNMVACNKVGTVKQISAGEEHASRAINRHLDQAADAYGDWKKVQEGDVARNADVLKEQVVEGISAQDSRLEALQEELKQIESNLQLVGAAETSAAMDFRNQLTTAQLLVKIEIGDASFRLDRLKEFLGKNF